MNKELLSKEDNKESLLLDSKDDEIIIKEKGQIQKSQRSGGSDESGIISLINFIR